MKIFLLNIKVYYFNFIFFLIPIVESFVLVFILVFQMGFPNRKSCKSENIKYHKIAHCVLSLSNFTIVYRVYFFYKFNCSTKAISFLLKVFVIYFNFSIISLIIANWGSRGWEGSDYLKFCIKWHNNSYELFDKFI